MLRDILEKLANGEMSLDDAEKALQLLAVEDVANCAKLDLGRELRHGVPEVVIAEGKYPEDVAEITTKALAKVGRVIVSRVDQQCLEALKSIEGKA